VCVGGRGGERGGGRMGGAGGEGGGVRGRGERGGGGGGKVMDRAMVDILSILRERKCHFESLFFGSQDVFCEEAAHDL